MRRLSSAVWLLTAALFAGCGDDQGPSAAPPAPLADAGSDGEPSDSAPDEGGHDAGSSHKAKIDELVAPVLEADWTVGMVVGLVSAQDVEIYAYGVSDTTSAVPMDADGVFEIGSITKTFTSLLLAMRVEQGGLTLDQPAQQLLPAEVTVPERNGKPITLAHLSTHTSGLPRMPSNFAPASNDDPYIDYDVQKLYAFLNGHQLVRDPGGAFEYSNLGAGLLGHALAHEASTSFEQLLATRITQPLGMNDTSITLDEAHQARLVQGHNADLRPVPTWTFDVMAPAGALRSTAADMLVYASAQSGLVSSELAEAMQASHVPQFSVTDELDIGLGWLIEGDRYVWHNGGTGGFGTFVGFDSQTKTGVVVLFNAMGIYSPETVLGMSLVRMVSGEAYDPPELPPTVPLPVATLEQYAGAYQTTIEGQPFTMSIVLDDERLWLSIPGDTPYGMYAMSEDRFYLRTAPAWITFESSGGGIYDTFVLEQTGGDTITAHR